MRESGINRISSTKRPVNDRFGLSPLRKDEWYKGTDNE